MNLEFFPALKDLPLANQDEVEVIFPRAREGKSIFSSQAEVFMSQRVKMIAFLWPGKNSDSITKCCQKFGGEPGYYSLEKRPCSKLLGTKGTTPHVFGLSGYVRQVSQ